MTLIRVKNQKVVPLPRLVRMVIKYIYEKDSMRLDDIHIMMDSIVWWAKKENISEDEKFFVQRMGWMLKEDELGNFDERKRLFKEHQIDWKKFHGFKEAS